MGTSGGILTTSGPDAPTQVGVEPISLALMLTPQTLDVPVTWTSAFLKNPTGTYIRQDSLLGKATASVLSVSMTGAVIRVVNTSLVALGTMIYLVGWTQ